MKTFDYLGYEVTIKHISGDIFQIEAKVLPKTLTPYSDHVEYKEDYTLMRKSVVARNGIELADKIEDYISNYRHINHFDRGI